MGRCNAITRSPGVLSLGTFARLTRDSYFVRGLPHLALSASGRSTERVGLTVLLDYLSKGLLKLRRSPSKPPFCFFNTWNNLSYRPLMRCIQLQLYGAICNKADNTEITSMCTFCTSIVTANIFMICIEYMYKSIAKWLCLYINISNKYRYVFSITKFRISNKFYLLLHSPLSLYKNPLPHSHIHTKDRPQRPCFFAYLNANRSR